MSWRQFFDVLGLPIPDLCDAWPEDPQARLKKKFERTYFVLVRRRLAIERLRLNIERAVRQMGDLNQDTRLSLEQNRRQLQRREANYQLLLKRMARTKRKLASFGRDAEGSLATRSGARQLLLSPHERALARRSPV